MSIFAMYAFVLLSNLAALQSDDFRVRHAATRFLASHPALAVPAAYLGRYSADPEVQFRAAGLRRESEYDGLPQGVYLILFVQTQVPTTNSPPGSAWGCSFDWGRWFAASPVRLRNLKLAARLLRVADARDARAMWEYKPDAPNMHLEAMGFTDVAAARFRGAPLTWDYNKHLYQR